MKALKTLLLIFVFAVLATDVFALTVSGLDAPSICPNKVNPSKCKSFFSSITLENVSLKKTIIDDSLDTKLKNVELGYIPKGSEVKISWKDYGDKSLHDHYELRYRCTAKPQELLFDDQSIHPFWYQSEKYWSIPSDFSWYKVTNPCYCKIWIASKGKYLSGSQSPTWGGANTRPFRICAIVIPPEVTTLDPDYSKISLASAVVEGDLTALGRNEDREVFYNLKDVEVWFEYQFVEADGTHRMGYRDESTPGLHRGQLSDSDAQSPLE